MCYVDHSLATQHALKKTVKWSHWKWNQSFSFEDRKKTKMCLKAEIPRGDKQSLLLPIYAYMHLKRCLHPTSKSFMHNTNNIKHHIYKKVEFRKFSCFRRVFSGVLRFYKQWQKASLLTKECPLYKLDHSQKKYLNKTSCLYVERIVVLTSCSS